MRNKFYHSILLTITIAVSFFITKTEIYAYELQITGIIFIIYFLIKKFIKNDFGYFLESIIFTFIISNLVISTGGTQSPIFFLIYFLIFGLSLLLEPIISITVSLVFSVFFILLLPNQPNLNEFIIVLSLPFLAPFALFLGNEHQKNLRLTNEKENNFLFLSLMIRNHLKNISEAINNFMGDHEISEIKKNVRKMEKMIDEYENN